MNTPSQPDAAAQISAYLTERLDTYLEELRQLCAFDCGTANKPGVDAAGEWVKAWAEKRNWTVDTEPNDTVGNSVIVSAAGKNPSGSKVLLVAHLDTVFPVGIAKSTLEKYEDRLRAPGIADNKSGLLSGLYAMAALEDLGYLDRLAEVCLVCGGDEETGMEVSGKTLEALAPKYDAAFVLEAARASGAIVSARKGVGDLNLTVHGRAAHAGVEPHKGANAIVSLAQIVAALHKLNGVYHDVTVNAGVIEGGTAPNVVPDYAMVKLDIRYPTPESRQVILDAIKEQIAKNLLDKTTYEMAEFWMPPMARTDKTLRLAEKAVELAKTLGFDIEHVATGGGSYANLVAGWGVPVLDGLGPVGGDDHNAQEEYILPATIVPRTALLALLLLGVTKE